MTNKRVHCVMKLDSGSLPGRAALGNKPSATVRLSEAQRRPSTTPPTHRCVWFFLVSAVRRHLTPDLSHYGCPVLCVDILKTFAFRRSGHLISERVRPEAALQSSARPGKQREQADDRKCATFLLSSSAVPGWSPLHPQQTAAVKH